MVARKGGLNKAGWRQRWVKLWSEISAPLCRWGKGQYGAAGDRQASLPVGGSPVPPHRPLQGGRGSCPSQSHSLPLSLPPHRATSPYAPRPAPPAPPVPPVPPVPPGPAPPARHGPVPVPPAPAPGRRKLWRGRHPCHPCHSWQPRGSPAASQAVQFHPNEGQFDFARSPARTVHPHEAYA